MTDEKHEINEAVGELLSHALEQDIKKFILVEGVEPQIVVVHAVRPFLVTAFGVRPSAVPRR
jgi:hypothetical protein